MNLHGSRCIFSVEVTWYCYRDRYSGTFRLKKKKEMYINDVVPSPIYDGQHDLLWKATLSHR
jgi:hypothetical protein